MKEGLNNGVANYDYCRECFGEPAELLQSENNPETLIDKLLSKNAKIPEIYMCCGTEDFWLERNREFHKFLCDRQVAHGYFESAGSHDMPFGDEYTEKSLNGCMGKQHSDGLLVQPLLPFKSEVE